jgi:cation transport regulator ChaC
LETQDGFFGYFGYGSLVNRQTLQTDYVAARPARLCGWRRHWQARPGELAPDGQRIAMLSVHRRAGAHIDGLLIVDRLGNLPALDQREAHYDRVLLSADEAAVLAEASFETFVYVARATPQQPDARLLQSYLDAVMAGFLREHGEAGLAAFLETTDGFEREIICDRSRPLYPRAVELPAALAAWFDKLLAAVGVRFAA